MSVKGTEKGEEERGKWKNRKKKPSQNDLKRKPGNQSEHFSGKRKKTLDLVLTKEHNR